MAFWRIGNGFSSVSPIDKILDKGDHTLIDLLNEPDLLQELLAPNTKLIEYLRQPEVMSEMVKIVADLNESLDDGGGGGGDTDILGSVATNTIDATSTSANSSTDSTITDANQNKLSLNEKELPSIPSEMEDDDNELDLHTGGIDVDMAESEDIKLQTKRSRESDSDSSSDKDEEINKLKHGLLTRTGYEEEPVEEEEEDEEIHTNLDTYDSSFDEVLETKQRHAQVCSEILSADVWSLTEALMEYTDLIEEIWKILDYPTPLDITYASYFTKISEHLLDKKTDEMLSFIRSQKHFVNRFMKHIDNPPLMDFLLKVISTDKSDNSTGIIEFLQGQKLIPSLISFLGPDVPSSVQSAAGDFLKAFVTISANSNTDNSTIGPNELSRELVSEPIVRELLRLMLFGGSGLGTGVGVIIEIIRKNNSDYDLVPVLLITIESHPPGPRDPIYLGTLVKLFAESIPKFQEILSRTHDEKFDTPFGQIEPLGFERFKICELIAELLHCSNMSLLNDPSGEAIIKARDEERRRVKRIIARARGEIESVGLEHGEDDDGDEEDDEGEGDETEKETADVEKESEMETTPTPEDHPIENKIGELSIKNESESDATTNSSIPNGLCSDDDESESGNNTGYQSATSDTEIDPINPQDLTLSQSLSQQEKLIRQGKVVGDQLKIALADNKCITTILEMFFKFPWNNFLHNVVFDIVQQILNGPMQEGYNKFLAIDLFGKGHLTEVIYNGHAECERHEREEKTRLGYMGHLTLISEEVVKFTALYTAESVSPVVAEAVSKQEWIHYVTHTLVRTREQYNTILGGKRPDGTEYIHNPNAVILGNGEENENNEDEENEEIGSELGEDDNFQRQHHRHASDEIITDNAESGIVVHHRYDDDENKNSNDLDNSGDQFARYMSQQISGTGHFGSSDEDEDDEEWDSDRNDYRGGYHPPTSSTSTQSHNYNISPNQEEEDEEEDDLGLVRSRSYNDMN